MTKAEILREEILLQYRSVRQFAVEMQIPYSTLVTALDRGIEGMAYGTVMKICDHLNLNPVSFRPLENDVPLTACLLENQVMMEYLRLNRQGQEIVLKMMGDMALLDKYKANEE